MKLFISMAFERIYSTCTVHESWKGHLKHLKKIVPALYAHKKESLYVLLLIIRLHETLPNVISHHASS